MIHAKNEKSRAPHIGGRVIIVRGPVTCLRVVLAVPIVPGTGIATDCRVAIVALQYSSSRTGLRIIIASAPPMQSKSVSISQRSYRPIGQIVLSDKIS